MQSLDHPTPNRFDVATRRIAENAAPRDARVAASEKAADLLQRSKASLQGDHKPLHSIVARRHCEGLVVSSSHQGCVVPIC